MFLTKLKQWFTPVRLFLAVGGIALLIMIVAGIRSCSSEKAKPTLPALIVPKQTPAMQVPPPTKRAATAASNLAKLSKRLLLPRRNEPVFVIPPAPTAETPTAVLQQQVRLLTREVFRLRNELTLADSVLLATREQAAIELEEATKAKQVLVDTLNARTARYEAQREADAATVKTYAKAIVKTRELLTEEALTNRILGIGRKSHVKRIIVQLPKTPE